MLPIPLRTDEGESVCRSRTLSASNVVSLIAKAITRIKRSQIKPADEKIFNYLAGRLCKRRTPPAHQGSHKLPYHAAMILRLHKITQKVLPW